MTTSTDAPGQIELPVAGSEVDTLLGALDRNRRTFAWKCFGLSAEEMRRTGSSISRRVSVPVVIATR